MATSDPDNLSEYDIYGKTPPRTKILRKNRERRQREKPGNTSSKPKKTPVGRRNTINSFIEIFNQCDIDSDNGGSSKKLSKRNLKLQRGSERDMKLDIASAQSLSGFREDVNSVSASQNLEAMSPQPSYHVESKKRFKSLSCRTKPCVRFRNAVCSALYGEEKYSDENHDMQEAEDSLKGRVEFHQTFKMLIRMGCNERQSHHDRLTKRTLSREEHLWQTELKDLIWLELQAYHAGRSCIEEDEYLCSARTKVHGILDDIMNYKFKYRTYSTQNSDSGVEEECSGCLMIQCMPCLEAQNEALRDIERLSRKLEEAEALFPSGKAFAELFPLYNSPKFVAKFKTISLWYNITRHQRLKMVTLAKFIAFLDTHKCQWIEHPDKVSEASGSPSDSYNSNSSGSDTFAAEFNSVDYYNTNLFRHFSPKSGSYTSYRKYIANMIKTRALNKSLNFMDKLHNFVLKKTQITLEKPDKNEFSEEDSQVAQEAELRRYGCWSPEAKEIGLPSYRASFLFLAGVPLEVIHEFLKLRLEQKPDNPSPLSARQLMRELKLALNIATTQKNRMKEYIASATNGFDDTSEVYIKKLRGFDNTLLKVFDLYLEYVQQWALLHHETFQQNLLEEEFLYSTKFAEFIPGATEILERRISFILSSIFKTIGERLISTIDSLVDSIPQDKEIKHNIFAVCRELQTFFTEEHDMSLKTLSFTKVVLKHNLSPASFKILKEAIINFKCSIPQAIAKAQTLFDYTTSDMFDETEKISLTSRIREILMQNYKFGFEFHREVAEGKKERRRMLVKSMVQFANLWMTFVIEKCDRGRGMRPRWAYQGLEFLLTVCEPENTKYLTEEEFDELKQKMDRCISHVIGTTAPSTPETGLHSPSPRNSLARSRGSSPSPRPTYKSQRSARKTSTEQSSPVDQLDLSFESRTFGETIIKIKLPATPAERTREAIDALENELDDRLRKQELIGKVVRCNETTNTHIRQRYVNFTWQRGIKIGQGRFGKVYTAVNNRTGEMMAVKEISLQYNDDHTIKRVSEEMKILEGISHKNLVKYYGVEVHREEMLLFMQYCEEGTLESLVSTSEHGLPEPLIRNYTYQLVSGVQCLHDHGIVHRDIKTANIFLTDEGNCLKIGDFGCAAKIKLNTTMPGELKGFVGTQAYMAPEVFTKNMAEGHGRAADIWSVGCVVVEMASGKRPWSEFDSNYQIMFKVGMGQSPDPPDNLIDEGLEFLELCFKFNPRDRATAHELLLHSFVKGGDDL